jgi:2-phosphoglycerate kinase
VTQRFRRSGEEVVVVGRDYGLPYSKGLMAQSMMAAGLRPARAYDLARAIELRLRERAEGRIDTAELRALAEEELATAVGPEAVIRFRQWQRLHRLDRPLIVMLGGAAGTGKSTLAALLAHRLGITRLTATDTIRQVLRASFAYDFMPAVHYSSFEAGGAVRLRTGGVEDPELQGFLRQAEHVGTGVRAIVERAIQERTPMVLEGVHLVPGVLREPAAAGALVVDAMLCVPDAELHRSHFHNRGAGEGRGPAQRYLEHFETIRRLQDHLVSQAHAAGTPVIENQALDASLSLLMSLVLDAIAADEAPANATVPTQEDIHA